MLDGERLEQINGLWHEVCVELVQIVTEKGGEVLGHLFALLQTGSKSVGEGSDIGNVIILGDLLLLINELFEFSILVLVQEPLKDGLLDFLVVLILKEFIGKEPN